MKQVDIDFHSSDNANDFYNNLCDQGVSSQCSTDHSTGLTTVTFYKE